MTLFSDDTTDNDPYPIVVQNSGNVVVDIINITATNLFQNASNPTTNYQFKIDNSTELNSFNYSNSITDWSTFNSSYSNVLVKSLDYVDTQDTFELDIKISVPADEPLGAKSSTINVVGEYE